MSQALERSSQGAGDSGIWQLQNLEGSVISVRKDGTCRSHRGLVRTGFRGWKLHVVPRETASGWGRAVRRGSFLYPHRP